MKRATVGSLKKGDIIAFTGIRDANVTARILRIGETISLVRDLATDRKTSVFNHMMVTVIKEK